MEHSKKKSPPVQNSPNRWSGMEERERRDALKEINKRQNDKTYKVRESKENFHGLYEVFSFDKLQPVVDVAQTSARQSQTVVRESYQSMHEMIPNHETQLGNENYGDSCQIEDDAGLSHLVRIVSSHPSQYSRELNFTHLSSNGQNIFKKSRPHGKSSQTDIRNEAYFETNTIKTPSLVTKTAEEPLLHSIDPSFSFDDPFLGQKSVQVANRTLFPKIQTSFAEYHLQPTLINKGHQMPRENQELQTVFEAEESQSKTKRRSSVQSSKDSQMSSAIISSNHQSTFETNEEMVPKKMPSEGVVFEEVCNDIHCFLGSIEKNLKHLVKKCNFYKKQCSKSKEVLKNTGGASRLSTAFSDREKPELTPNIDMNVWKLMSPGTPLGSIHNTLTSPIITPKNGEKTGLFFKKTAPKLKKEASKTPNSLQFDGQITKAPIQVSSPKNFNPLDFSKKPGAINLVAKQGNISAKESPKSIMKLLERSGVLKANDSQSKSSNKTSRRPSISIEKRNFDPFSLIKEKFSRSTGHCKSSASSKRASKSPLRQTDTNQTLKVKPAAASSGRKTSSAKPKSNSRKIQMADPPAAVAKVPKKTITEAAERTKQLEKVIEHLKKANAEGKEAAKVGYQKIEEQSQSKSQDRKRKLEASMTTFLQTFADSSELSSNYQSILKPRSHLRLKTLE